MKSNPIIDSVKEVVHEVEPDAAIILYGSRARGDATAESDWDFVILVQGPVDDARIDKIRHSLYEIEWEKGQVISSIVRNHEDWDSPRQRSTPFHQTVTHEGIVL